MAQKLWRIPHATNTSLSLPKWRWYEIYQESTFVLLLAWIGTYAMPSRGVTYAGTLQLCDAVVLFWNDSWLLGKVLANKAVLVPLCLLLGSIVALCWWC